MADHFEAAEPEVFESQPASSRINPVALLWRHKWLVLFGVVAGTAFGALYYGRATPIYESKAQVLVVKKDTGPLPATGPEGRASYTEDYLSTHQTLIRSPAIVQDAVQKGNLASLQSFAGGGDPTGSIIASLKLSREMNAGSPTNILNISYRGPVAEDCAAVLAAVISSYQRFLSAKYKNITDETAKLISQASEVLEDKINKKQKEYDRFKSEHLVVRGKDGVSYLQERLLALEAKRSALLLEESEISGRLSAFEKAVKEGRRSRSELLLMIPKSTGAGSSGMTAGSVLERELAVLELQEESLAEKYGSDYQPLATTRKQIAQVRSQLGRLGKTAADEAASRQDPIQGHLQGLKMELENNQTGAEALAKVIQQEQEKTKVLRDVDRQDESFRTEIERSQQLLHVISKRLEEVNLLKNFAGGYEAETITAAGIGGKVYPKPFLVFTAAILLGLLGGFGLVYLAELSDQSFRTPEEIRRRLGLPVVGHVPFFEHAAADAQPVAEGPRPNPVLCALYHPKSREAEAYRGVRTALFFSAREGNTKVIQVTSPDMGDGKTTLAANLVISIAQAGKKVIVVDADFRRPRLHKLFGVSSEQGLASVINGEAELCEVIRDTAVPGLFVLPCGPIPPNPAELLTQTRFQELLAVLREQYDFVVIDTPPLLVVTDPCVIVPHADAVILTVRISKNARPHAMRARDILSTLGAKVLGVVVNGVGRDAKGYGYDGYRYGYTYKYYNYHAYGNYGDQNDTSSPETNGEPKAQMNGTPGGQPTPRASSGGSSRRRKGLLAWLFKH